MKIYRVLMAVCCGMLLLFLSAGCGAVPSASVPEYSGEAVVQQPEENTDPLAVIQNAVGFRLVHTPFDAGALPAVPQIGFPGEIYYQYQVFDGVERKQIDGVWRYLDRSGEPMDYENIHGFSPEGYPVTIAEKQGKFGILDADYEVIIPLVYDKIFLPATAKNNTIFYGIRENRWEIIDFEKQFVVAFVYCETSEDDCYLFGDFDVMIASGIEYFAYRGSLTDYGEAVFAPAFCGRMFSCYDFAGNFVKTQQYFIDYQNSDFALSFRPADAGEQENEVPLLVANGNISFDAVTYLDAEMALERAEPYLLQNAGWEPTMPIAVQTENGSLIALDLYREGLQEKKQAVLLLTQNSCRVLYESEPHHSLIALSVSSVAELPPKENPLLLTGAIGEKRFVLFEIDFGEFGNKALLLLL